jgi:DNA-binding XRE family transcriptional regulator
MFGGDDIRRLRKEGLGWSQAQLGSLLHAHSQTISRWEKGASEPDTWQTQMIMSLWEAQRRDSSFGLRADRARGLLGLGEIGGAMGALFGTG